MKKWDNYLQELETYPADVAAWPTSAKAATLGDVHVTRSLDIVVARAGLGLVPIAGAASAFGFGWFAQLGASLVALKRARLAERTSGQDLLQATQLFAGPWLSLLKQEEALGSSDDHAGVTFRLVTLAEAIARDLLWRDGEPYREAVVAHCGPGNRSFIAKVIASGKGATISVLAAWIDGLERATLANDEKVLEFLSRRIANPRGLAKSGLADMLRVVIPTRNMLAHPASDAFPQVLHFETARCLLGVDRVCRWWRDGATDPVGLPTLLAMRARLMVVPKP